MPYFAVIDSASGELVSTGTVVASRGELERAGRSAIRLEGDGPPADLRWNPKTRAFDLPLEQPDAEPTNAQRLEADPEWAQLSAAEKRLARVLARALGRGGMPAA